MRRAFPRTLVVAASVLVASNALAQGAPVAPATVAPAPAPTAPGSAAPVAPPPPPVAPAPAPTAPGSAAPVAPAGAPATAPAAWADAAAPTAPVAATTAPTATTAPAAPLAAPSATPSAAVPSNAARSDRTGVNLGWTPERQFAVYGQLTSLLVLNTFGASFEYRPIRAFSVSGGLGYGVSIIGQSFAGQVAAHGLFGPPGPHSFEVSVGVAPTYVFDAFCFFCGEEQPDPRGIIMPSAFLGYRYQAMDKDEDGIVLRVGPGWNYGTGVGLGLSLGYAF